MVIINEFESKTAFFWGKRRVPWFALVCPKLSQSIDVHKASIIGCALRCAAVLSSDANEVILDWLRCLHCGYSCTSLLAVR
jgi:hypothetical protein